MKKILVLTGRGRFADPWHDLAATSNFIALILQRLPNTFVEVRSTFRDSLDDLDDFDLLVLNISRAEPGYLEAEIDGTAADWEPYLARIVDWTNAGGKVFAVHAATLAAGAYPELEPVVGGIWIDGVSGHPPIGDMELILDPSVTKLGYWTRDGVITPLFPSAVTAYDERYCRLKLTPSARPIGWVTDDPLPGETQGERYPAMWLNPCGKGHVVYSALGHGPLSYASASHQQLVEGVVGWMINQ